MTRGLDDSNLTTKICLIGSHEINPRTPLAGDPSALAENLSMDASLRVFFRISEDSIARDWDITLPSQPSDSSMSNVKYSVLDLGLHQEVAPEPHSCPAFSSESCAGPSESPVIGEL